MDKGTPDITPPKWADKFLEWYCSEALMDEIQGDLHEAFYLRAKRYGAKKARFLFVIEVILFFRPSSFKKTYTNNYPSDMPGLIQNYLKISLRNTLKSKVFSLINIFGLSIGLAACFLISLYVFFEHSYDKFHRNSEQIYRVTMNDLAVNHPGTGPALEADFPEVGAYARVVHQSIFAGSNTAWSHIDENGNETVFNQKHVYNVDASFLTMFSFPFVFGDPETALSDISSVVISESVSQKFFGDENPIGKVLKASGYRDLTVTGVFEDIPENSHIKFDILVSYFFQEGWGNGWQSNWDWMWPEFFTYVELSPTADVKGLEEKLPDFVSRYLEDIMKEYGMEYQFHLQPLTGIHLRSSHLGKEMEVHGDERTVYFLTVIGSLILVIAWINYINLSTSKSVDRAHEVGLRKVIGANKQQLIFQFLLESMIINLLAIILAFTLVVITLPFFEGLIGKNISKGPSGFILFEEPLFWLLVGGIFIIGSFLAGLYPAFILSSFKEASVLKGKFFSSRSGIISRKILVGFQFAVSAALIAGTITVIQQVEFMRKQDLGYEKDRLLIVQSPLTGDSTYRYRLKSFKTALRGNPAINGIAPSSEVPGKLISQANGIRNIDEKSDANSMVYHLYVDHGFIDTYGIELLAGRNFRDDEFSFYSRNREKGPQPVIVNKKVLASLGYEEVDDAIGQLIYFARGTSDQKAEIIGVVENYHQRSLKDGYDPILFFYVREYGGMYLSINLDMQNVPETISFVEEQYEEHFPSNQFGYFFLDDFFDRQYAADQQFEKIFSLFSGLALFVAALGLFGLSTFMISQRTKEIAVRKVLGAKIAGMVYLFSKDFVKLILVANIITLPVVYFLATDWLNNFAFQVGIHWSIFVIPTLILFIISFTTVSFQTIKTSSINPIKSLRSD